MAAKLIKTEADRQEALERIDDLMDMDFEPGVPECDELELLAELVERFEKEQFPSSLPDPIDAIRFRMDQAGLIQKDLVEYIGSAAKVSEILRGKRPLSLAMIRRLHQGLGIPASVLLQDPKATAPPAAPGLECDKFPLTEMANRGWIDNPYGSLPRLKDHAEETILEFVQPLHHCGVQTGQFAARRTIRQEDQTDGNALLAWCVRVASLAKTQGNVADYRTECLDDTFFEHLVRLSIHESGPRLAREFLAQNGVHMVVLKHLPKTKLDGAAMMLETGNPVVGLSVRHDRIDNFWFTLLHELGHIKLHFDGAPDDCFVDEFDVESHDKREGEADAFAQNSLIPPGKWNSVPASSKRTPASVRALAAQLRIHPSIIAGRIQWEQDNYRLLNNLLGRNKVQRQFPKASEGDA